MFFYLFPTKQGYAAEKITNAIGTPASEMGDATKMGVSLSSGVIAGVAAAIISHPADSLLSMVNKEGVCSSFKNVEPERWKTQSGNINIAFV